MRYPVYLKGPEKFNKSPKLAKKINSLKSLLHTLKFSLETGNLHYIQLWQIIPNLTFCLRLISQQLCVSRSVKHINSVFQTKYFANTANTCKDLILNCQAELFTYRSAYKISIHDFFYKVCF
jgi:hypothetical protein